MKRPVFVVGCPRSGTTLLYSLLLAAGGFSVYRKETYFFEQMPRYPRLSTDQERHRFRTDYLAGYLGSVPGLDVAPFVDRALARCRRASDFLPILMDDITRAQGMTRWLEGTPAHVLHLPRIKQVVPDALIVHVVRDGRDCALSNDRQGWLPSFPWDARHRVGVAALFWEWMVLAGRNYGRAHPDDYREIRFEDLVREPQRTLESLETFLDHELDYSSMRTHPMHSMHIPNTSFRDERSRDGFNPVDRWQSKLTADERSLCDALIGHRLEELGYERSRVRTSNSVARRARMMRAVYTPFFRGKHMLKARTPLGRWLTSPRVWYEQPRRGERPIAPLPELGPQPLTSEAMSR